MKQDDVGVAYVSSQGSLGRMIGLGVSCVSKREKQRVDGRAYTVFAVRSPRGFS